MGAQQCHLLRAGLEGVEVLWLVVVEVTRQLLRVEGGQLRNTEERGLKAIDLKTDLPCNNLPEPVAGEAVIGTAQKDLCLSKAAARAANLRMAGDFADKFAVAEDDATASPVPERVWILCP